MPLSIRWRGCAVRRGEGIKNFVLAATYFFLTGTVHLLDKISLRSIWPQKVLKSGPSPTSASMELNSEHLEEFRDGSATALSRGRGNFEHEIICDSSADDTHNK